VHAILDHSAEPFLRDLTIAVRETGRRVYTFAESNLNDPRVIAPMESHGLGFDAQWSDDLHHALHTLLTGEKSGYYIGYGAASDLARVMSTGYLYTGQHSVYRGRKYGAKPKTTDGAQFVVFTQNHDQVGNRMHGDRLAAIVSPEKLRLAAAVVILSPFLPMLFMGEEYGETAPFQYFTSHSDPDLIDAVRRGRREEFKRFDWVGEAPDPHDEETFQRSKLTWKENDSVRKLYRDLLRLRREKFRDLDLRKVEARADDEKRVVTVRRGDTLLAFNFSDEPQCVEGVTVGAWDFAVVAHLSSRA
jgi:maltooligosyltrehalose trehalohydrolase